MAAERELTPAAKIMEMATARRGEQMSRVNTYDKFLRQYFGPDDPQNMGAAAVDNYSDGRPALRAPGETASGKGGRAAPNYIKPIVKDLVAIRGVWPQTTVPPATAQDGDKQRALLTTRALRQQHENSRMVGQQQRAGFFLASCGDVCYTLDPRTPDMAKEDPDPFRPVGVYFQVVSPKEAFPKFRGEELVDLFVMRETTLAEAREEFPGLRLPGDDPGKKVDVIHYYSKWERQTVVAGVRASGILHELGFCPAEWAMTEATDGHWAQADIAGTTNLHEEVQDLWRVHVDSVLQAVYPIIHIHEATSVTPVEIGPGAKIETTGAGKVELLAPQANPQASALIFDGSLDNLMKQSGMAPIRLEGQIDRSNVSARSVDRQQAPMEQRLKLSMELLGQTLQRLNSKCLLMLSKVDDLKKAEMELYGQDRDGIYSEKFTGEDIGGWIRNVVKWPSLTGTTQEQQVLQRIQLYKEGTQPDGSHLFPFEEVVGSVYDDPREIMDRAKSEHPPQPPTPPVQGAAGPSTPDQPGGAPSLDAAGQQQQSLAAGGPQGPPGPVQPPPPTPGNGTPGNGTPPGVPNFPPVAAHQAGRGRGSPALVPDIMGAIQAALAGASLRGEATPVVRNESLVVEVSDYRDVPAVKAALKPVEQQLGITVNVKVTTGRT